jgi:signal transduction histidine kinase
LQGLCHAFASAPTFEELATSTARWARSATGCDPTHVSFALPDSAGRLSVAWRDGASASASGGRKRSVRRRTAFRTKRAVQVDAGQDGGLALFPLVSRGTPFGVLEITAPRQAIHDGWELLEAVASQAAITFHNLFEQRSLRRQVETLERATTLGRDLVRANDPDGAAQLAVRFVGERFELPVAGWVATANSQRMVLTSVRGLGSRKRKQLNAVMGAFPRWSSLSSSERGALVRRFREVLGAPNAAIVEAGDALLLVADAPASLQPTFDAVGSLLAAVLLQLAITAKAERRNEQLDMGIAWTAHELRAPLIDVKAVLEFLLAEDAGSPIGVAMLQRSLLELEELVGTTEGLLGWAVGAHPLRRRVADVIQIVSQAIHACELGWGEGRMSLSGPTRAMARIDPVQLRRAIENVLRNALACSDRDSEVAVSVNERDDVITVSVRDQGPGIPEAEWDGIFDPFVRGSAARSRSGNGGLGLFIARRVLEAHGGRIWVDSDRRRTMFHLQVPIELARARRSAS